MTVSLDLLVGFLCGQIALCAFSLHIATSPKRRKWMTVPEYVRRGFIVLGAMFMWRSVDAVTIAMGNLPADAPGRVNPVTVMAMLSLAYCATALTIWVWSSQLPDRGWERVDWLRAVLRRQPQAVPVVLDLKDAIEVAHADGLAATGPGESAEAVVREMSRRRRALVP